jgi:hypothetical protein
MRDSSGFKGLHIMDRAERPQKKATIERILNAQQNAIGFYLIRQGGSACRVTDRNTLFTS